MERQRQDGGGAAVVEAQQLEAARRAVEVRRSVDEMFRRSGFGVTVGGRAYTHITDHGASCVKCGSTVRGYLVERGTPLVDVHCYACGAADLFAVPLSCCPFPREVADLDAAELSAAHRQVVA